MAILSAMMDHDTDDILIREDIDVDEWIRLLNGSDE
jgi:hypothetical protein